MSMRLAALIGSSWALGLGCASAVEAAGTPEHAAPPAADSSPSASALPSAVASPASASAAPPVAASSAPAEPAQEERRARLQESLRALQEGGVNRKDGAFCKQHYEAARGLAGASTGEPEASARLALHGAGARCAERAGDCKLAWWIFLDSYPTETLANLKEAHREQAIRMAFGSLIPSCKER